MELPHFERDLQLDQHIIELVQAQDGGFLFAAVQGHQQQVVKVLNLVVYAEEGLVVENRGCLFRLGQGDAHGCACYCG